MSCRRSLSMRKAAHLRKLRKLRKSQAFTTWEYRQAVMKCGQNPDSAPRRSCLRSASVVTPL